MKDNEKILADVQVSLTCPKGQYNSFGKYKYRSVEDILTVLKPYLEKYKLPLSMTDELVQLGNNFYLKCTVEFAGFKATGYAREPEQKKGMDPMQITGCAASYARKYALCALFAIDNEMEIDAQKPEASFESSYNIGDIF